MRHFIVLFLCVGCRLPFYVSLCVNTCCKTHRIKSVLQFHSANTGYLYETFAWWVFWCSTVWHSWVAPGTVFPIQNGCCVTNGCWGQIWGKINNSQKKQMLSMQEENEFRRIQDIWWTCRMRRADWMQILKHWWKEEGKHTRLLRGEIKHI